MTKVTNNFRLSLDIQLRHPKDAAAMVDLANVIEDCVRELRSVKHVEWTEAMPSEPDFEFGDWNALMQGRGRVRL